MVCVSQCVIVKLWRLDAAGMSVSVQLWEWRLQQARKFSVVSGTNDAARLVMVVNALS